MVRSFVAVVLLLAFSVVSAANFVDGSDLHKWYLADRRVDENRAEGNDRFDALNYLGYVTGATDSFNDVCILPSVKRGQLGAIVGKFLEDHPDSWNYNAASVVHAALKQTYPCPQTK